MVEIDQDEIKRAAEKYKTQPINPLREITLPKEPSRTQTAPQTPTKEPTKEPAIAR